MYGIQNTAQNTVKNTIQSTKCEKCGYHGGFQGIFNQYSNPAQPMHFPVTTPFSINQTFDPATIVNQFLTEYYKFTTYTGWNAAMHLFDKQCMVIYKDKNVGNSHDLLNTLTVEYIKKANYDTIRSKWMLLNANNIIVNIFGRIQFVSFSGNLSNVHTFTEVFVLTVNNGIIICTHHMFDF